MRIEVVKLGLAGTLALPVKSKSPAVDSYGFYDYVLGDLESQLFHGSERLLHFAWLVC